MTRLLLLISCVCLIVFSCKKYTCECTAYMAGSPDSGGKTGFTVKKRDRKKMCTDRSTQPDVNGDYTTCIIK